MIQLNKTDKHWLEILIPWVLAIPYFIIRICINDFFKRAVICDFSTKLGPHEVLKNARMSLSLKWIIISFNSLLLLISVLEWDQTLYKNQFICFLRQRVTLSRLSMFVKYILNFHWIYNSRCVSLLTIKRLFI